MKIAATMPEHYKDLIVNGINALFKRYAQGSKWPSESLHNNSEIFKAFNIPNGKLYRKYYNLKDRFKVDTMEDLQEFVKKVWLPFIVELKKIDNKVKADFFNKVNNTSIGLSGSGISIKFDSINDKLNNLSALTEILFNPQELNDSGIICYYSCNNTRLNYYIYLHICNTKTNGCRDVILCLAQNEQILSQALIRNDSDDKQEYANAIIDKFDEFDDNIFSKIKNNNENLLQPIEYQRNPSADGAVVNVKENVEEISRYLFATDFPTIDLRPIINNSKEWEEYVKKQKELIDNKLKSKLNSSSNAKSIQIKMSFSYIKLLNELIRDCQKEKAKYRFERVASKKGLFKFAVRNNELIQLLQQACNVTGKLVASYYYKITTDKKIDENDCAGIVILINNTFLTIPSHAYSSFHSIINEYRQAKNEINNKNIFTRLKDRIKNNSADTIDVLFNSSNLSIRDIAANPFADKNKYIYKYILNNVNGVKEFNTFNEANKYFKQNTSAQHVKVESSFSHLVNNDTNIEEHILCLTIMISSRTSLYYKIDAFVNKNAEHILNLNQVRQQLNSIR